ncbi:MAG TPA: AraC family transcriptional regulator [Allosphingosinicella sp.]|nr:AraC family transcriptional regulator [Allosphingosinicella sp.]
MSGPLEGGTHGLQRHPLRAGPFVVSTTEHGPHFSVGRHAHERASVNIVLGGVYRETFSGESAGFVAHTFVAKPPGEAHSNAFGAEGARCLLIEVEDETVLRHFADVLGQPVVCPARPSFIEYAAILRELDPRDALSPISVESRVLQLLVNQSRGRGRVYRTEPAWLKRTLEILHSEPPRRLSLAQIAGAVGVHPVHLARTFRRSQGISVGGYARRLRVERALELLRGSTLSLSHVAAEAGFYDQSHMSRVLKQTTGMTPGEARAATAP